MHERFSDRARHAMALANLEAGKLNHGHLAPGHLMLGLIAEGECVATEALSLLDVPKWQLTGALFGVVYMMVMVGAVPVVGTAVATVAVIVGQLGMGMLIDNFGWLGNPAIELSGSRIVAMACLALALVFMYRSNTRTD